MPNPAELLRHDRPPMGVAATVLGNATNATDPIDVTWIYEDDDGEHTAGEDGLRWAAPGTKLPQDGDDALLLIDNLGDPWALVWATG